jgi:hypothetical protein
LGVVLVFALDAAHHVLQTHGLTLLHYLVWEGRPQVDCELWQRIVFRGVLGIRKPPDLQFEGELGLGSEVLMGLKLRHR